MTKVNYYENGTLIVKNATTDGSYACFAKNFIGTISKLIRITVNSEIFFFMYYYNAYEVVHLKSFL
jgi:hypothetical protein